jgi:hypothetical protein
MFAGHSMLCPYRKKRHFTEANLSDASLAEGGKHARASPCGKQREQAPALHMRRADLEMLLPVKSKRDFSAASAGIRGRKRAG